MNGDIHQSVINGASATELQGVAVERSEASP